MRSIKAKSEYASDDFIVGYRLSPEDRYFNGNYRTISIQLLKNQLIMFIYLLEYSFNYKEGKYGTRAIEINSPMGGWSYPSYWCRICTADDALDANQQVLNS